MQLVAENSSFSRRKLSWKMFSGNFLFSISCHLLITEITDTLPLISLAIKYKKQKFSQANEKVFPRVWEKSKIKIKANSDILYLLVAYTITVENSN